MVGFADTDYHSQDDLRFIHDYCTITRNEGEVQCICDEKGHLHAIHTSSGIIGTHPDHDNIRDLCMAIEPLLENAKGSIVRTTIQPKYRLSKYCELPETWETLKIDTVIYPIFQGKLLCEFYNVTLHIEDIHQEPTCPQSASSPRFKPNRKAAYCTVDARTGLFLETSRTFETLINLEKSILMRSRCEELGMKDLLLLATLIADRKCFFQSHLRSDAGKHWFLSETIIIDERECIRIWCPENVVFPESHLTGSKLAKTYCDHWENKPERVLICDDNELLVDTCCSIMDWAGIHYNVASNGKEALHHLESGDYQCVFLDLNMPKLNGFDTARLIRQSKRSYRTIPLVAMTATPLSNADLSRQLKHFDSILQKPFDIEDVKVSIEQARSNVEMKKRVQSGFSDSTGNISNNGTQLHSDYEPTPFMVKFGNRNDILEDLRNHILSTLESNLAFLGKLAPATHQDHLKSVIQRTQSMAISIGAWKLSTHSGIFLEYLNHPEISELETTKESVIRCLEEAICFYNTVNWEQFISSGLLTQVLHH